MSRCTIGGKRLPCRNSGSGTRKGGPDGGDWGPKVEKESSTEVETLLSPLVPGKREGRRYRKTGPRGSCG